MPPLRLAQVVISAQLVLEGMPFFSRFRAPLTSRNHRATEAVDELRFVDGGSSHERRPLYPLGAPASGNRDGGIGRADPRPDRQPQAASNAALVLLRRRLYTGGLAPDCPADGPALILRPRTASPEARQRQRPADVLALLAESSVRSYRTWIADLRHRSPAGSIVAAISTRRSSLASRSTYLRTCQSKQRGGISTPRRSPRLRNEATPLGRASLRRRPSSCPIVDKIKVGGVFADAQSPCAFELPSLTPARL